MKYGFYDDKNKEYVINSPKTPYPWINYLGTQDFFGLISNTAGGYDFYKDARLTATTTFPQTQADVISTLTTTVLSGTPAGLL